MKDIMEAIKVIADKNGWGTLPSDEPRALVSKLVNEALKEVPVKEEVKEEKKPLLKKKKGKK